ncbi:MAG: TRAP transporter small permease [Alphaproteobacteria bacterium]|nr:TRAP transporter small permease [Alphaproteobacteria bacterium]
MNLQGNQVTSYLDSILTLASRVTSGLRVLVTWLVIGFFGYMAVMVLAQVIGRYLFNYSIDWAAETATFAQIWMIFLAAGLAMRQKLHVSVDALTNVLPVPILRFFTIIIAVPCLWFLWQAIVGSLTLINVGQIQTSPVLQIPMWIPYLSLPLGLGYFGLELVLSLVAKWKDPKGTAAETEKLAA